MEFAERTLRFERAVVITGGNSDLSRPLHSFEGVVVRRHVREPLTLINRYWAGTDHLDDVGVSGALHHRHHYTVVEFCTLVHTKNVSGIVAVNHRKRLSSPPDSPATPRPACLVDQVDFDSFFWYEGVV